MPYHHLLWSVERDRDLSRTAAEQYAIMNALTERQTTEAPKRGSNFAWRRLLRRRPVAA